jgi:flavodoxin
MSKIVIPVGTVYGKALDCARQVKQELEAEGFKPVLLTDPQLEDVLTADVLLVMTSTTGAGDLPPELENLYFELEQQWPMLSDKKAAIFCLGDSSYGDTFCGAGIRMQELLDQLGVHWLAPIYKVDAMETYEQEREASAWLSEIKDKLPQ